MPPRQWRRGWRGDPATHAATPAAASRPGGGHRNALPPLGHCQTLQIEHLHSPVTGSLRDILVQLSSPAATLCHSRRYLQCLCRLSRPQPQRSKVLLHLDPTPSLPRPSPSPRNRPPLLPPLYPTPACSVLTRNAKRQARVGMTGAPAIGL